MWDKWMKQVDIGQSTSLLDLIYVGCTQRECKPILKLIQEKKDLLESLIPTCTIKQVPDWERSHVNTMTFFCDMVGHEKIRDTVNWKGR